MRQCSRIASTLRQTSTFSKTLTHAALSVTTKTWPPYIVYILPRRGFTSSSACSSTIFSSRDPCRPTTSPVIGSIGNKSRRQAHSASNSKWLARQSSDRFTREAKVADLKSRAAFKLLQINERYRILKPGMTVVDLGYAPGSWSQVAIDLVRPGIGRVIGVDMIPIQPPKGVNGLQGNFLSPEVQERVREFVQDTSRGKVNRPIIDDEVDISKDDLVDINRTTASRELEVVASVQNPGPSLEDDDKHVDVVLSDMSAPWEITSGHFKNSISNPYRRMMNTTGNKFRDHAGSMDLCRAALYFSFDNLKVGGSFVCKFYQGAEDKVLERQLKALFGKVHREKPESSRSESRESFFVCVKRLAKADRDKVFNDM